MPRDVFYTNPSHLKYCSPVTSTSFQPSHHVVGVRSFQHQRENLPTQVLQSDLWSPSWRQLNLWNCHLTNPQKRHKNCQGPKIKCKIIPWCHVIPSQASLWKETATQKTAHLWPQRSFWQKGQSSVFPRTHLLHCYIRLFPGNNLQVYSKITPKIQIHVWTFKETSYRIKNCCKKKRILKHSTPKKSYFNGSEQSMHQRSCNGQDAETKETNSKISLKVSLL